MLNFRLRACLFIVAVFGCVVTTSLSAQTVEGTALERFRGTITNPEGGVVLLTAPGNTLWASRFGSSNNDQGRATAVDANGDVLSAGGQQPLLRDPAQFHSPL